MKIYIVATADQTGNGCETRIIGAYQNSSKAQRIRERYNERSEVQLNNERGYAEVYAVTVRKGN